MTPNRIIQTKPLRNAKTVPDDFWKREAIKAKQSVFKSEDTLLVVVLVGILVELFFGK